MRRPFSSEWHCRFKLMAELSEIEKKDLVPGSSIPSARNNGRSAFSERQESVLERQDTIFTDLVDRQENSFRYPSVVAPYLK